MKADKIFKNARVFTADKNNPQAEALAVKDGKFVYVGDEAGLSDYEGEVTDLGGRFIMPGIIDSHVHITTGVGAAIVEELLGVPREDVIADYLMTNEYLKEEFAFLTNVVGEQAGSGVAVPDEALRYLFGADRDYIEEYYRTIGIKYGSFERFIEDGLRLSAEDIRDLRSTYLLKGSE